MCLFGRGAQSCGDNEIGGTENRTEGGGGGGWKMSENNGGEGSKSKVEKKSIVDKL